jgi:type VI secretion system secreted protein VgrG
MTKVLSQKNRTGVLTTPLGTDTLVLTRFDAQEALSELFEYRIEALSEDPDLDFNKAIGLPCTVTIESYKGEKRNFNGILTEAQWIGVRDRYYGYRLVLRPWLYLLSHTSDCRIFEKKKVPDIIMKVFQDRGFTDVQSLKDASSYPELDYCVQYRETDLNFVLRLMEKEGIYYYFKHEQAKHTLVLADSTSSHDDVPNHGTIPYLPPSGKFVPRTQRIEHWMTARRFRTGKFEFNDYNYEKPTANMIGGAQARQSYAHSDMEIYEYPGNYKEPSDAERYARIALQAEQAQDNRRQGGGDAPSLFPGGLTKLEKHPSDSQNSRYLIVRAVHSFAEQAYISGTGGGASYSGQYEFLPYDSPFRAPIVTPKPRIYGVQTAVVVDKQAHGRVDQSSEEIEVEQLSEIYVSFYWDRRKHDEKRSCKLRCAQKWAGKNWGGQFIPRIGMEVIVEFLDGDPDRPIVVGCLYNQDNQPPYDLPGQKNVSGMKSDSTKGHGGYNELNFDDSKKSEKVTFHAEKDHAKIVKHAETTEIGETFEVPLGSPSREVTIKNGDDKLTVKSGDHNVEVSTGNQKIKINLTQKTDVGVQIEIICGPGPQSKITMNPAEIKLEAMMITLDAQILLKLHGTMVQMQGDAMTQIQGGIVMIN